MTEVLVVVRCGERRYALSLHDVVEVADLEAVLAVPGTSAALRGLTPVRGRLVPRVRLDVLLHLAPPGPLTSAPTVVIARAGGRHIALEVDDVERVLRDAAVTMQDPWAVPCAAGVTQDEEGLLPVLDVAALLARLDPPRSGGRA